MKKLLQKNHFQQYFYFICFFILCVCDQRIGSALGEIQLVCPNIVLMVLSCLVLTHYPLSDYRRRRFWIPALIWTAAAGVVLGLMWSNAFYRYQLISGGIAAVLYGCVLIQTACAVFSGRRLPGTGRAGAALLALLTVWILISRHDMYNGFLLCLSVLLMYLTDFTEQECGRMLTALGGAVLAAFFVFQGLAFVFRPYDSLRYLGLYANTNINALFYQMVYCVFFGYFCILELKRTHPFLKWWSFCFACAMWPFVLLTMCRSAVLGMAAATAAGVGILLWKRRGARVSRCLLYLCGLFLGSALSFPIVYGAVRYLPAVFHHPIWFADEYSEEKVHSWDPYDSGKYTDWRDVLRENFGRFFPSVAGSGSRQTSVPDASGWEDSSALNAPKWEDTSEPDAPEWEDTSEPDASEWEDTSEPDALEWEDTSASDASGWEDSSASDAPGEGNPPVSPDPEAVQAGNVSGEASANGPLAGGASVKGNSVAGRMVIYRHYLSMLNLRGHAESENGIQLTEHFYAPHAHNIVLQYAFNYGLPAGILLLAYMAASGIRFLLLCIRNENGTPVLLGLLLFASIAVFGMLEVVWRYGQLSHALLLLLPRFAWQGRTGGTDSPEIHAGGRGER